MEGGSASLEMWRSGGTGRLRTVMASAVYWAPLSFRKKKKPQIFFFKRVIYMLYHAPPPPCRLRTEPEMASEGDSALAELASDAACP